MIPIALTVENVEMYVRDRVLLLLGVQEASVISVEEITQHTYVNWVFHVSLSNNSRPISVYLRQSRNYTKARPDVYMDPDRTVFEARILRLLTDIVTDVTPEVLWHDQENNVLVLTDVRRGAPVLADELRNGRVHLSCSWSLGRTIAQIHDATRAIANSRARGSDMANRVAKQTSQELRLGPARALHPGDVDRLLRMSDSAEPGLVLGDLGPKNIFVDRDIARFVDMERAFVGDQSFDLGFLLAHYLVEVPRLARSDSILAFRAVIASYRERLGHAHSHADQTFETRLLRWLGVMILYRISDSYMGRPIREDLSFWSSCAASLLEADSSDAVEAVTSLLGR